MIVAFALPIGVIGSALAWRMLRPTFQSEVFSRQNYRGHTLPVGAGILLSLSVLGGVALLTLVVQLGLEDLHYELAEEHALTTLLAAMAFGLLGLVDDLAAVGHEKGFGGHLGALRDGRLTTGALKLFGGGVVALVLAGAYADQHVGDWLLAGAVIALAANLGNLFDRAPGRATKAALVGGIPLLLVHHDERAAGLALVLGAGIGLLLPDLSEQLMLGDAGANVLGGAIGLGVVATCSTPTQIAVLVLLLVLNLASEWVSFSDVIERTPPLRWFDRLGRVAAVQDPPD